MSLLSAAAAVLLAAALSVGVLKRAPYGAFGKALFVIAIYSLVRFVLGGGREASWETMVPMGLFLVHNVGVAVLWVRRGGPPKPDLRAPSVEAGP